MRFFPIALALVVIIAAQFEVHGASITSDATVAGSVGQPLSYQITADNSPIKFSASGLSNIAGISLNANSGLISGTPQVAGTFNVTVNAQGFSNTASKKIVFSIAKAVVNFTSASAASGDMSSSFSFQLASQVSDATYSASGLPPGLKLGAASGLISGIPTTAGVFAVSLTASGKVAIATGILTITINGGNAPPSAISLVPTVATVNVPYTGAFSAKGAPPITFTIQSGLPPGIVTTNGNVISGTPTTTGVFAMVVNATNAFGSAQITINFTVAASTGAPSITSPLSVNGEVGDTFFYNATAAGKAPIAFSVDPTKLPRGLAQTPAGDISGVPFDPGTFTTPFSATNSVGSDNENLTITVASLTPGNTHATIKFADQYRDVNAKGGPIGNSNFNYTALVDTPSINASGFFSGLDVDVTVGIYEFSAKLGDATKTLGGKFTPGKSAAFNFTDTKAGRPVRVGSITFTLGKGPVVKIVAHRKGTPLLGGITTLRAQQLAGTNQIVNETLPVKIQIGATLIAAFYVPCQGSATVKTVPSSALQLSTVKLKGAGSSSSP
jgi:hypothetical protein